MRPVLDDQGPALEGRVGRVDDATQERLEPAPVLGARLEELAAGEARRVDAHPAPATEDEALQRVLLALGHVERRQVELDHHRVAGELLVAKDGGVVREVDGEAVLGPQGLEKGLRRVAHRSVVAVVRRHHEHAEGGRGRRRRRSARRGDERDEDRECAQGPTCSSTAKSPGFQACAMM